MAYWSPDELESASARDATLSAQSLDVRVRVLVSVCALVCVCLSVCASLDSVEGAAEPSHPLRALRVCLCAGNAQQQSALQENDTIRLRRLPGCPAHRPTSCLALPCLGLLPGRLELLPPTT